MTLSLGRARVEAALAVIAAALGLVTIFWQDWIEVLTGLDPDHHGGSFEWLVVFGLLFVSVVLAARAGRDFSLLRTRDLQT